MGHGLFVEILVSQGSLMKEVTAEGEPQLWRSSHTSLRIWGCFTWFKGGNYRIASKTDRILSPKSGMIGSGMSSRHFCSDWSLITALFHYNVEFGSKINPISSLTAGRTIEGFVEKIRLVELI